MFLCCGIYNGNAYQGKGSFIFIEWKGFLYLTDTGENVQKWTRGFSTRRWVILVARKRRKRRKKREENSMSTFERFRLWTSFESPPVSVNSPLKDVRFSQILFHRNLGQNRFFTRRNFRYRSCNTVTKYRWWQASFSNYVKT